MSHNVHPYSHRLGIIRDWKSDVLIRQYLEKRLKGMYIGGIEIERSQKAFRIIIKTSRPGMIIGRSGEGATKLRNDIVSKLKDIGVGNGEDLKIDIEEIRSPESSSAIVVQMIAEGLEKRMPFRRVMKQTIEKVMANREVQGVKIYLGGRLGGADMARSEVLKKGRIPLQTFRADIDYAIGRATIPQGDLGIKVWIYKGDIFASDIK